MHVKVKTYVWQKITLDGDEDIAKEKIIDVLKKEGIDGLYNIDGIFPYWETLYEGEALPPTDNEATIQLYDNDELFWDNLNEYKCQKEN